MFGHKNGKIRNLLTEISIDLMATRDDLMELSKGKGKPIELSRWLLEHKVNPCISKINRVIAIEDKIIAIFEKEFGK